MNAYLHTSEAINWRHPEIRQLAHQLATDRETPIAIVQACFEWVRDEIYHSADYRLNPVTWRASDVLKHRTGYCFAKSHLLAALLRANHIPAGLCYQRLSIDDQGAPYSLHGLNAVYLPSIGWYRLDPRGNKADVNAQFSPPQEQLAYTPRLLGEADFQTIFADPLPTVLTALQSHSTWDAMRRHLPDIELKDAIDQGLTQKCPLTQQIP
jgi:transglutaminase-like putative cysteine protease